jgi:D-glycero-beta-D-manno-heptose 1-phosphate adenylyltransferase
MGRVVTLEELLPLRARWKAQGSAVVFTNGVFDILHRGHCEYLAAARALGDLLVVGVNSDASVRRLKGEKKPIVPEDDRAAVLASLASVDYALFFDDDTPRRIIAALLPDVLAKGADYALDDIVGRKEVEGAGGRVARITLTPGRSSTTIVQTVIDRYCR